MEGPQVRLQLPAFVQERSVDRSTAAQGSVGRDSIAFYGASVGGV
jgi:hypothetical protein